LESETHGKKLKAEKKRNRCVFCELQKKVMLGQSENIDPIKEKKQGQVWGIYFSFHSQTRFVNSSLLRSFILIPSDASIFSTTN
jgi:hypothetical protein